MCANASSTASPSLSLHSATSRSFLSRLSSLSPMRSRSRNLTEFHIRPDEPHRKYSPGDIVKGAVILTVVKPIRITHLTVCLHGFVRVFKSPQAANEPFIDPGLTASHNPRRSQYFGNGHASLFQDELTLCGEGRLDTGVYEFNFELEFPSKDLPTSIDFERGTISYLITSTITRPTSINATMSCDQKLSLVETVDIGPMLPPKPRTIYLEPITRKTKRKRTPRRERGLTSMEGGDMEGGPTRTVASPTLDDTVSMCDSVDQHVAPQSPVPSDRQSAMSVENSTDTSSSTELSFQVTAPGSIKAGDSVVSKGSLKDQTITATIELLKSGCLPGDNLPLKISINHTKAIRSMHGIIITLYRQGRIDSAPPLSLFADITGKEAERLKHEEYYPKSKTGLGGLSLTSAGSSSMFRKDLAQKFAPILVDPSSLTAIIHASVRVPEDVFPTICGVPGQMITFKYNVEVVVDLGGKLAGQQRHVPLLGAVLLPSSYLSPGGGRADANPNMLATWGGSIVGTENIRREKSVVACVFEVTVGSRDSARNWRRGNSFRHGSEGTGDMPITTDGQNFEEYSTLHNMGRHHRESSGHRDQPYPYQEQYQYHSPDGHSHRDFYEDHYQDQYPSTHQSQISNPVPGPQVDEGLSEKELARRAEERLLPSCPPTASTGPFTGISAVPAVPSAPPPEAEYDLYTLGHITQVTHSMHNAPDTASEPTAPSFDDFGPAVRANPTDDKQELERRRLLAEASAPCYPEGEGDVGASNSSASSAPAEPSAPTLVEYGEEAYSHAFVSRSSELLPKYEK